jgi:phosphate butyryltransferase
MLNTFEQIKDKVKAADSKKKVLVWNADDAGWLKVLANYQADGYVEATLIGDEAKIKALATENGIDITSLIIQNSSSMDEGLAIVKQMLSDNSIDILIRGNIGVKDSLKALFSKAVGFRNGKALVSAASCHYVKDIERMLIVSDPVVNPAPDLNRKIAIVNNAVRYAHGLGDDNPRVAMLAAVEVVYPVMPHTVEGAAIAKMSDRRQIKGCVVDGPLSMDVAVIESAAKAKGVTGEVAGNANVLIAPNIETAYGMYKAFSRFVAAPSGCIVIGGRIPYCMASRSDSEQTKEHSLLMAMI